MELPTTARRVKSSRCPSLTAFTRAVRSAQMVEPEYLGRVLGLTGAIMTLASPVGLGLTALFAGAVGLTVWFLLSGAVTLACGGLMLLLPAVRTCSR